MPRWLKRKSILIRLLLVGVLLNGAYWYFHTTQRQLESFVIEQSRLNQENVRLTQSSQSKESESELIEAELTQVKTELDQVKKEYETLRAQDQLKRNDELQAQIKAIESTYDQAVDAFEALQNVKDLTKDTDGVEKQFATVLTQLSKRDYPQAGETLKKLNADLVTTLAKLTEKPGISVANVPINNAPPGSGYSRQQVQTDSSTYVVDLIAGNLDSTRVIVDTASDNTCANDCPVLSLGDYVSRNGGFAGINGSYFCPASYPSCAGKTNSFDTLLMNKNKVYFNSDNNVYSTVPAVIFGGGWVRFVGRSLDWGRDTGIDSMIANQPLLVSGGNSVFGGDGDPKKGTKGTRSFVANKGNTVYIGVVHNATVAESALALKTLGMENGLNLDSGGSTALWSGGYKVGPGRNIPNAIVFVRK